MFKPKIGPQGRVDDLDRHGHELPAFVAYIRFVATCPDLIVIRQIYIENKLLSQRTKSSGFAERLAVSRVCGVDGANFESGGVET